MTLNRRSLITGLISLAAAPAIVRASSLMPVKGVALKTLTPEEMLTAFYKLNFDALQKGIENLVMYGQAYTKITADYENLIKLELIQDHEFYEGETWK